jgi:hypothetical protein
MLLKTELDPADPVEDAEVEPAPPAPTVTVIDDPIATAKAADCFTPPAPPPPAPLSPTAEAPPPPPPATTKYSTDEVLLSVSGLKVAEIKPPRFD